MSHVVNRISRMVFVTMITGLLLVMAAGCATTGSQAAKSEGQAVAEKEKSRRHSHWRYRHKNHRHSKPVIGRKAVFPCKQCDGGTEKVDSQ